MASMACASTQVRRVFSSGGSVGNSRRRSRLRELDDDGHLHARQSVRGALVVPSVNTTDFYSSSVAQSNRCRRYGSRRSVTTGSSTRQTAVATGLPPSNRGTLERRQAVQRCSGSRANWRGRGRFLPGAGRASPRPREQAPVGGRRASAGVPGARAYRSTHAGASKAIRGSLVFAVLLDILYLAGSSRAVAAQCLGVSASMALSVV